mmetsp:Transcript_161406/g.518203  ORF Transcript_161406/g.518203 Transcript_161406/m.518203 type:complete len:337 (-) Transcript_161406:1797-2807(-)
MPKRTNLRRMPSFSLSLKPVMMSPCFLPKRPRFSTASEPSCSATARFTSSIDERSSTVTTMSVQGSPSTQGVTRTFTLAGATPPFEGVAPSAPSSLAPPPSLASASSSSSAATACCTKEPRRWKPSSPAMCGRSNAAIISKTPLGLPSKPYFGNTALCTVRNNFCCSNLNFFGSVLARALRSCLNFSWKASSEYPCKRSCNRPMASSSVSLGALLGPPPRPRSPTARRFGVASPSECEPSSPSSPGRSEGMPCMSTPSNSNFLWPPRCSVSLYPSMMLPCFWPRRPRFRTASLPRRAATATLTSRIVARAGTRTSTASRAKPSTQGVTCTVTSARS